MHHTVELLQTEWISAYLSYYQILSADAIDQILGSFIQIRVFFISVGVCVCYIQYSNQHNIDVIIMTNPLYHFLQILINKLLQSINTYFLQPTL